MGPPRPRAGTLAEGRGVGAGRGAGGARGVGRHGWRMASLLSTLPLPPPPVTAPPSARHPHLRVTVLAPASPGHLRLAPRSLPPSARIPAPGPTGAAVAGASLVWAARASCPSRGFGPAAPSRARGPSLSLDRALPSPSLARPLSRYSAPPPARVRSPPPVGRVRHKGSCALTPHLQALPPPPSRPFRDFLPPLRASRSTISFPI